jgi:hypothetical protein
MKTKLAVVIIPEHWDPSDLCHPSVNEPGSVLNARSVFTLPDNASAEAINPTVEEAYWREKYVTSPAPSYGRREFMRRKYYLPGAEPRRSPPTPDRVVPADMAWIIALSEYRGWGDVEVRDLYDLVQIMREEGHDCDHELAEMLTGEKTS